MIEANELRIGNWISIPECAIVAKVDIIGEKKVCIDITNVDLDVEQSSFLLESLYGIPIKADILLKAGFTKKGNYAIGVGHYLTYFNGNFQVFFTDDHVCKLIFVDLKIENLHTLQNCFFALTGKELEITL